MRGSKDSGRTEVHLGRRRKGTQRGVSRRTAFVLAALACIVAAAVASAALAQGAPGEEEVSPFALTPQLIEEANRSPKTVSVPEVDTEAAHELPHTDLDQAGALELLTSVFADAVEAPAGIYDEIPAGTFIGTNAMIVSPGSAAEAAEADGSGEGATEPSGPALIESATPLRVEDDEGAIQPVDLSLEHAEGELQAENPIVPVGIPTELGEGVELAEGQIGISFAGAAPAREATVVEGDSAFYGNVQEDTDLLVAPMPTGVETLTQIRSAAAPRTQVDSLSLPAGAALVSNETGGAEVKLEGRQLMEVSPASAVDAAGEPVPTTMTVSGDQLQITVEPGDAAAYPILVDPNFRLDEYNWKEGGSPFTGWQSLKTAAGYYPFQTYSQWRALDLQSWGGWGGAAASTGANWLYFVPRYNSDLTNYGQVPTSWIEFAALGGMMYLNDNGSFYPEIVAGLQDPVHGFWTTSLTHNGTQGEIQGWAGSMSFNGGTGAKELVFALITLEAEAVARNREAEATTAYVELRDEDTPTFTAAPGNVPTGWVNTGEYALSYQAQDTGLGVAGFTTEVEGQPTTAHTFALPCNGTNQSPCPRVAKSTETGRPAVKLNPQDAPTGIDRFQVGVYDPLNGYEQGGTDPVPHKSSATVTLKVDHTAPEVALSGALTEQEKVGTKLAEYPLTVTATDGTEADPQSGLAKVEVKVDGKKVTMANEATWNPNCTTQNCTVSSTWTLKASGYTVGSHEVEVLATDAVGNVSNTVLEIEAGQGAPQTSFTSPHPRFEVRELPSIAFRGTREGKAVEGATFKCSLDGASATACSTPYTLPEHFGQGWHTFSVAASDKSGIVDPTPAIWKFRTDPYLAAPATEKLVYPEVGAKTASYYTLEAEWGGNPEGNPDYRVNGVTFQVQMPGWKRDEKGGYVRNEKGELLPNTFETVPAGCVIDDQGHPVSWPISTLGLPGHTKPVYLKVRGCRIFETAGYPEKEIQFRAVFDGGEKVTGASAPATTEFVSRANANRVATDATEQVGPASLDLLTGAFTMSRTDVSIPVPGYEASLEFTRTYSSTVDRSLKGYSLVLGGVWQPGSPLESESEGQAWSRIVKQVIPEHAAVFKDECWEEFETESEEGSRSIACPDPHHCTIELCEEWEEEPFQPHEEWIELLDTEGAGIIFEISGGNFIAPEYAKELKLTMQEGNIVLAYPNGSRNIFVSSGPNEWMPKYVSFQATPSSIRLVYQEEFGELRLMREIAPAPVKCEPFESEAVAGCRTLAFEYATFPIPGHYFGAAEKLVGITYYGPSGNKAAKAKVAEYSYKLKNTTQSPCYGGTCYAQEEMLVGEKDPRLPIPAETYTYDERPGYGNLLSGVVPAGVEGWAFEYEYGTAIELMNSGTPSRLKAVIRAGTKTTIAYGVPVSGSGAPYDMSAGSIAKWGQADLPVDATAVFPPTHVPSEYPPHEYSGATVHYMDPDGYQVNVASPSPPGITGASIATSETDVHGNVVRQLDPQNRLYAIESSNPPERSRELDTHSVFNAAGTEQLESWGPLHKVRLKSGEVVEARQHNVTRYDEGAPTPPVGTPPAYLPTKETSSVVVPGKAGELEPQVTETHYEWSLRKPTETIVDPGGLAIRSVTEYNTSGQVVQTRQPKDPKGEGAGTTRTQYYIAGPGVGQCESNQYANLPCKVLPVAQVEGAGRPKLLVKQFTAYNNLDEPTFVKESAGGEGPERITTTEYDEAGRPVSTKNTGGASTQSLELPATKTAYSSTTGAPVSQFFACVANCTGFDTQATAVTYDSLGRVKRYEDADGNVAETTYDAYGRPVTTTDGRGSKTITYDAGSGMPTKLEVSGIGTFTARYDADNDLVEETLPNGLSRKTTYNAAGEPTNLVYSKTSSCGSSCTWFEETLERAADGRIVSNSNTLAFDRYIYDKAGRLEESLETPVGGTCTTRKYTFDSDSNRLTKTTRTGVGGTCSSSGGTTQSYEYDGGDRLMGTGVTYDSFGRITSLAAAYTGSSVLSTGYFATNMVATQTQSGVTNSFQLDAAGRQRQREQTGGVAGTEVLHYDSASDSPSWTALGATWSRNIVSMSGALAAVQESNGTTIFKLTNVHGDVVASASASPTATKLLATYRSTEFGEPAAGTAGRFGWLGANERRTEMSSGVVQMGARNYIPQLGRFLTPDPIRGGSANAYDYVGQDPVNGFDLGGELQCETLHNQMICGFTTPEFNRKYGAAKRRYRREARNAARAAEAASRRSAALAHHRGPAIVVASHSPHAASEGGGGIGAFLSGVGSTVVHIGEDADDVIPFAAAKEAFKRADDWSPGHIIQAWECGWALSKEDGSWKANCDPIELILGEETDSADG